MHGNISQAKEVADVSFEASTQNEPTPEIQLHLGFNEVARALVARALMEHSDVKISRNNITGGTDYAVNGVTLTLNNEGVLDGKDGSAFLKIDGEKEFLVKYVDTPVRYEDKKPVICPTKTWVRVAGKEDTDQRVANEEGQISLLSKMAEKLAL